jgi:hypothetical protein
MVLLVSFFKQTLMVCSTNTKRLLNLYKTTLLFFLQQGVMPHPYHYQEREVLLNNKYHFFVNSFSVIFRDATWHASLIIAMNHHTLASYEITRHVPFLFQKSCKCITKHPRTCRQELMPNQLAWICGIAANPCSFQHDYEETSAELPAILS